MGGIWKENWKRGAKKSSISAFDGHDLVRVEDLNGFPFLSPSGGSIIIGSGLEWIGLSVGASGFVLTSNGTTVDWEAATGGGGIIDLTASGFVVGPVSAVDRSIAVYDGTTGKLVTDSLVIIDSSGNLSVGGNITVSGIVTNIGVVTNTISSGTITTYNITNAYFNAITSATTGVVLPLSPVEGQQHIIKDIDGTASITPIIVDGNGNTIDGSITLSLSSNYEAKTVIFGPTEWNII